MEKIKIGQIVNAVALKGEVKIYNYSDYKERYEEIGYIYTDEKKIDIKNVRYMKDNPILKLDGVDDRNAAETLKGSYVYIDESQLRELPEDTYYVKDLIGMEVFEESGSLLGTLKDVIQNSAQDIYEVERDTGKPLLIPVVGEFVLNIDEAQRKITVRLIEGMLEL